MKVFSKAKYIADMGQKKYKANRKWVDACDGMEVVSCGPISIVLRTGCPVFKDWVVDINYKISIHSDGKTTTAKMVINNKLVKTSEARCHPDDKFNFKIGAQLAFQRLFERNKELKPGDKVRVRKDLVHGNWYGDLFCTNSIASFRGKTITIFGQAADGNYWVEESDSLFSPEMFE